MRSPIVVVSASSRRAWPAEISARKERLAQDAEAISHSPSRRRRRDPVDNEANTLAAALGLTPPLGDQTVRAPAVSERSETYLILIMLFTMLSVFGVVYWFAHTDISDHVALPLTLAGVLLSSLFTIGRRLCLRRLRSESAKDTRFSHHLSTAAAVEPRGASRDRDKVVLFALTGLIVITVIAAQRLGAQDLPESSQCWQSPAPRLCGIDVTGDGVPEAIGYVCVGRGPWASSELSHVDLAAAGAMVFIEAGRLAGLNAASGEIAWITKEE
jgi:hypothetical protein